MFGYAMIEEVRPRKFYWEWIRTYTILILLAKMAFNMQIFKTDAHANKRPDSFQ